MTEVIHTRTSTVATGQRAQQSIPYSYPGTVTVSTSPNVTPRADLPITGLSATLRVAGSDVTEVQLIINGVAVLVVTLAAGATYGFSQLAQTTTVAARSGTYGLAILTVGPGAVDLGGEIELGGL